MSPILFPPLGPDLAAACDYLGRLWCWLFWDVSQLQPLEWGGQLVTNVLLLQSWVPNYDWIYCFNKR